MDSLDALLLISNFVLVPGLTYGAQLALGALGITLIFSILQFSNFAYGDLMAFGTMCTILTCWFLNGLGLTGGVFPIALLALPISAIATVVVSLLIDRSVFRFYRERNAKPITVVMASVGVMFMLNGIVRFIIGPQDRRFDDGARFIFKARDIKAYLHTQEGVSLKMSQGLTIVSALVLVALLFWFLERTRTGKAMRAFSDNKNLALLSGIDPERVVRTTWIIAAILATISGTLYGLDKGFKPFTYFQMLLPMFAAAILGGIGRPVGAIAGGFIIAFSEAALTYPYRKVIEYLSGGWEPKGLLQLMSTEYKFSVSFIILILVLLLRPTGIFKGKVIS